MNIHNQILNLVDKDKSDIKYKHSKFPDNQQQITIERDSFAGIFGLRLNKPDVTIKSRLNNFQDLETIICATKSLRNLGIKTIYLYVPYFIGARSDRQFEEGSNNYLKDVICPIINSLNFESVTILDPHSYVLEACLNNFEKIDNSDLVKWATREMFGVISEKGQNSTYPCILISPDTGASHKIYKLAEQIGYKGEIITCSKERDTEGKLTKCVVPELDGKKDIIIIDDICDGGGTFINIAKVIRSQGCLGKLYLIVTHGIFSKGYKELSEYFDGIYCTNSYKDVNHDATYLHPMEKCYGLVKQLNIF